MESLSSTDSEAVPASWVVHKFGGTSVGTPDSMRKCIEIVKPYIQSNSSSTNGNSNNSDGHNDSKAGATNIAVVVSAMGGKPKVTDLLLDLVHAAAANRQEEIAAKMHTITEKHRNCANQILSGSPEVAVIIRQIESDLKDIADLLRAVSLMKVPHEQILELVSGYGEIWSATIMTEAMKMQGLPFIFLNARDVLFVSETETGTNIHWDESEQKLNQFINSKDLYNSSNSAGPRHLMITGYVASTLSGIATTLKRDGSDFSASIFGRLLNAKTVTIWTDVSGVFSADPRRVPDARVIPDVSYTEAVELAYFGAKVIHPKTVAPCLETQIPIYIKNTFDPDHPGTKIFASVTGKNMRERTVCGFSTIDNISLLNIEGTGMIGVPGIAHRLFGALKAANISVMFIAQASSEHSVCFATKESQADRAKQAVLEAFFFEFKNKIVSAIRVIDNCSIIAAVGEGMSNTPGVSGLFFGALGSAAINVLSIAQGCDERNISAVVYTKDATRALRAVHAAFWLSSLDISIGIVGTGRVGSALLQILLEQSAVLGSRFGFKLKVRGVANSRKMLLGDDLASQLRSKMNSFIQYTQTEEGVVRKSHSNVSLQDMETAMSEQGDDKLDTNLTEFFNHINSGATPHAIVIDASTSHDVAQWHPKLLSGGMHVVTANKRALSSKLELYNSIVEAVRSNNRMYMSEVTIGASLPVRTTLHDILCSGDAVHAIEGLMSVSLGMILTDMCDEGMTFTEALLKTYRQGLFEDDVFADLEGIEVAEKLLILARELGIPLRVGDVQVEPIAKRREVINWDNLGDTFADVDKMLGERLAAAKSRGCTLRYIQRIECTPAAELGPQRSKANAYVRLEEVPRESRLAMVKGAVYHFAFHTERYKQNPLVVQGPLSDEFNTASGIVGDLLRIARSIGAKDKGPDALII